MGGCWRQLLVLLTVQTIWIVYAAEEGGGSTGEGCTTGEPEKKEKLERYQVAIFDWEAVQGPYTLALWILLASVAKIGSF